MTQTRPILVVSVILLIAGAWITSAQDNPLPTSTVDASDSLGNCSPERWAEYVSISTEAAPLRFGGSPLSFADDAFELMRANINALKFEEGTTAFIAADTTTGDVFQAKCVSKTCTNQEANKAEMLCFQSGGIDCATVALQFNDELFCLAFSQS